MPEYTNPATETEAILERLDRLVRWSKQFRLAFLRCDDPVQEQTLRRRVNAKLTGCAILEIVLDKPIVSLLDEISSQWDQNHPPTAVSVFGLANSMEQGINSSVLGRLNHDRELLRKNVPASLLIWLPDAALNAMAQGAPDFWAWRSALLEFPEITAQAMPGAPKVFISSTVDDLKEYRNKARSAAIRAGFLPVMNEDWAAKDAPPLGECLERVDATHLTLAIVAHRYGWVPQGQKDYEKNYKSITRLECERTVLGDKPKALLAFVVDEAASWPDDKKEAYRLTEAALQGKFELIPALAQEVQRNTVALQEFKTWLTQNRTRATFATPEELERKVESALKDWLHNNPVYASVAKSQAKAQANPERYLGQLYEFSAYIDIRGLHVGSGRAHRFPIEDLYIELDTTGGGKLKNTLANPRRVIVGDPGAGKTTFLRWIAHALTGDRLGATANAAKELLGIGRPLIPVFVSIAEWLEYVLTVRASKMGKELRHSSRDAGIQSQGREANSQYFAQTSTDSAETLPSMALDSGIPDRNDGVSDQYENRLPITKDPQWLVHFLGSQSASREWGLDAEWFKERLNQGDCLLLFDGLDEAPDRKTREYATELLEAVAATWPKCPILVTSRPSGYQDRSVLPNFQPSTIEALNDHAVETFLDRWSRALHPTDTTAAEAHRQALLQALNARPNIRRLARNTVMLTALAVVHWNEKRLPEQRAELYESILLWLSRSRELRPGRAGPERSLEVLRTLALAMQNVEGGRKVQVTRHWAAEQIADLFPDEPARPTRFSKPSRSIALAEKFLEEEELDSGIIVRRGNEVRFWHLSFQEYLAARAIGGLSEQSQRALLFGTYKRLYEPEWREVGQLLGGVLYEQGRKKVDVLITAVLDELYGNGGSQSKPPNLADQARAVGLLDGIVRDLSPYQYQPSDPRYRQTFTEVMRIFEPEPSKSVPIKLRIETAEALGRAGDPRLVDDKLRWVEIPGGKFLMGAQQQDNHAPNYDPDAFNNELPPHWVEVDAFHFGRYPVTVQEYAVFIEDDGYAESRWWLPKEFGRRQQPEDWQKQVEHQNRPVVGVSWFEAMAYCLWLTDRLRRLGQLKPTESIRLPTEAEWEWAARGNTPRRYPWGDAEPKAERLNFNSQVGSPTPVGVYPLGATPEGVLDLAGNVWEWCADGYDGGYYQACHSQGTVKNPTGPDTGAARVVRGGSWYYGARDCRSAYRGILDPDFRYYYTGFRCARVQS